MNLDKDDENRGYDIDSEEHAPISSGATPGYMDTSANL